MLSLKVLPLPSWVLSNVSGSKIEMGLGCEWLFVSISQKITGLKVQLASDLLFNLHISFFLSHFISLIGSSVVFSPLILSFVCTVFNLIAFRGCGISTQIKLISCKSLSKFNSWLYSPENPFTQQVFYVCNFR